MLLLLGLIACEGAFTNIRPYAMTSTGVRRYKISEDEVTGVVVDNATGDVIITGWTPTPVCQMKHWGSDDIFVARYDSQGNVQWVDQFGDAGSERSFAITSNDRSVFTAGSAMYSTSNPATQFIVSKHNKETGKREWIKLFGNQYDRDVATAVAISGNNLYILGETQKTNKDRQCLLLKIDQASGLETGRQLFGSSGDDGCKALTVDKAGNIFVVGSIIKGDEDFAGKMVKGDADLLVIRFDDAGTSFNMVWVSVLGGQGFELGSSVAYSADLSALVVVGRTSSEGFFGAKTVMTASTAFSDEQSNSRDNLDCFTIKLSTINGNIINFGSSQALVRGGAESVDFFSQVVVTGTHIYTTGVTQGDLASDGTITDAASPHVKTILLVSDIITGSIAIAQSVTSSGGLHTENWRTVETISRALALNPPTGSQAIASVLYVGGVERVTTSRTWNDGFLANMNLKLSGGVPVYDATTAAFGARDTVTMKSPTAVVRFSEDDVLDTLPTVTLLRTKAAAAKKICEPCYVAVSFSGNGRSLVQPEYLITGIHWTGLDLEKTFRFNITDNKIETAAQSLKIQISDAQNCHLTGRTKADYVISDDEHGVHGGGILEEEEEDSEFLDFKTKAGIAGGVALLLLYLFCKKCYCPLRRRRREAAIQEAQLLRQIKRDGLAMGLNDDDEHRNSVSSAFFGDSRVSSFAMMRFQRNKVKPAGDTSNNPSKQKFKAAGSALGGPSRLASFRGWGVLNRLGSFRGDGVGGKTGSFLGKQGSFRLGLGGRTSSLRKMGSFRKTGSFVNRINIGSSRNKPKKRNINFDLFLRGTAYESQLDRMGVYRRRFDEHEEVDGSDEELVLALDVKADGTCSGNFNGRPCYIRSPTNKEGKSYLYFYKIGDVGGGAWCVSTELGAAPHSAEARLIAMAPEACSPMEIEEPWRTLDGDEFFEDNVTIMLNKKRKKRIAEKLAAETSEQRPERPSNPTRSPSTGDSPVRPYNRSGRALNL